MSNILIVLGLIIILFFALRGTIKHFKGEGSCCGGGNATVKEPDKILDGSVIKTKVFKIDGMKCENCTNRVKRAINRIDGVSAKLVLRKNIAIVSYEKDVEDELIIKGIEEIGYKVMSVEVQ